MPICILHPPLPRDGGVGALTEGAQLGNPSLKALHSHPGLTFSPEPTGLTIPSPTTCRLWGSSLLLTPSKRDFQASRARSGKALRKNWESLGLSLSEGHREQHQGARPGSDRPMRGSVPCAARPRHSFPPHSPHQQSSSCVFSSKATPGCKGRSETHKPACLCPQCATSVRGARHRLCGGGQGQLAGRGPVRQGFGEWQP